MAVTDTSTAATVMPERTPGPMTAASASGVSDKADRGGEVLPYCPRAARSRRKLMRVKLSASGRLS